MSWKTYINTICFLWCLCFMAYSTWHADLHVEWVLPNSFQHLFGCVLHIFHPPLLNITRGTTWNDLPSHVPVQNIFSSEYHVSFMSKCYSYIKMFLNLGVWLCWKKNPVLFHPWHWYIGTLEIQMRFDSSKPIAYHWNI